MNKRRKLNLKLNLITMFFLAVSFISVTLAWFIYSGLATVQTEVNVKAWYIELEKEGQTVSNNIIISVDEIYPGMETITETVKIKNLGDSVASVSYKINTARILGSDEHYYDTNAQNITSIDLEDKLAHEYPFHINMSLSKNFILEKTDEGTFDISISWPLDSGTDELDSYWGTEAYKFQLEEEKLLGLDKNYQVRPSIQISISLTAEQYVETKSSSEINLMSGQNLEAKSSSDLNYPLGKQILFDVVDKKVCEQISSTCFRMNVIDVHNKISDETVTLIPNILRIDQKGTYNDYSQHYQNIVQSWKVENRPLTASDVLKVISTDVYNSKFIRDGMSDSIIGTLKTESRVQNKLSNISQLNGYYIFNMFEYFNSSSCYWTNSNYNNDKGIAVITNSGITKMYGEEKATECKIVPVIIASKADIEKKIPDNL